MYIVILNYESGRVCAFDLSYKPEDMDKLGTNGASDTATVKYGEKFIELKVDAAVKQIEKERLSTH